MTGRLLLVLALFGLLVMLFQRTGGDGDLELPADAGRQQTGYYLRDATLTEYGRDGAVRMEVAARLATEVPGLETVEMEAVSVNYYALAGQRWRLTADNGHLPPGHQTVDLSGSVVMTGDRDKQPKPAVIRTERLTLDLEREVARTDAPVTLSLGVHALAATGMVADMKAETLQLESGVNGRFLP